MHSVKEVTEEIPTIYLIYNHLRTALTRFCGDRYFLISLAFLNLTILIAILPTLGSNRKPQFDRYATPDLPSTCPRGGHSGVEWILPQAGFREPFQVYCDQKFENGGWIVIQRRYHGSVDFYRGWNEYEQGFGNMNGEFWLGLRKIHELTYSNRYELGVVLSDWDGTEAVARYGSFLIAGPEQKYTLRSLGTYNGTAGDALSYNLNMKFSTFDADNDDYYGNCAQERMGAWWHKSCSYGNLNGQHVNGSNTRSMYWTTFKTDGHGLRGSLMLIRVVN